MPIFHRRLAGPRWAVAVAATLLVLSPSWAPAEVSLSFTDNDATPTATTVAAGSSFLVTLNLISNAGEQSTGLDYFLQDNAFTSGTPRFRIADRNVGGSTYSDTYFTDAVVEAQPASLLNAANDSDLGGTLANVNSPNGPGTFLVAAYTIAVDPSTPPATYTISTFSNAGTGYTEPGPSFTDAPFSQQATFSVTVTGVPEPGALALIGLAGLLPHRRRVPAGGRA